MQFLDLWVYSFQKKKKNSGKSLAFSKNKERNKQLFPKSSSILYSGT